MKRLISILLLVFMLGFGVTFAREFSARNALKGKVTDVKLGQLMAKVVIDVGGQKVTSIITKDSAEEMNIKVGDEVYAVVKSTSVMVSKK